MHGEQDGRPGLGESIIGVMEQEWYAVLPDADYKLSGNITIQCRICPWSIHFCDNDHAQCEHAAAAFIAHAKKLHSKAMLNGKRVPVEKL